ncbi:unnamed protein product [Timema podura]|uniref:C2H2-type domain-containing protein n=1 Tax=Timema podura TaxID=61482 RepID=A0ABN7P044_TIMPD|nr:unnamed protein product [Timema podura]
MCAHMFRYCVFIGEGGEEGAGEGEVEGEAADSPGAGEDAASSVNSGAMSPSSEAGVGGAPLSRSATPTSPPPSSAATGILLQQHEGSELLLQQHELDQDLPVAMLHDQLALRDTPVQRCPSRDSRGSSVPRCPSRDSQCSERGIPRVALPPVSPVTASSAVLPPTLLPPHSAALAAYLGAAAAQHQHHRLLMTSPLPAVLPRGSVSPLVTSSSSPPLLPLVPPGSLAMSPPPPPIRSPAELDSSTVLDFSTKRGICKPEQDNDSALNLSKPPTPVLPAESQLNSPLDLSVSSNRKRSLDASSPIPQTPSPQHHPPSSRKNSRMAAPSEYKPVVSPWTSPVVASHFPYFAAAVAAASSLSPKNNSSHNTSNHGHSVDNPLWNGKMKMSHDGKMGNSGTHFGGMPTPSDATKALEKMSELSKLGGEDLFRSSSNNVGGGGGGGGGSSNRHSAWQSHWLNKGAEQAKDVLKCVWCKQSFPSLAAMTAHMKEAKHCGVNVPPPQIQPPPPPPPPQQQHQPPTSSPSLSVNSGGGGHQSGGNKPSSADLNLLIKETMPLPRKLVRGQDVWLGKGAEQTRQILKCMWCGQSFRSLAEMTSHMQQTQHYTNIISQEQIISWKSADDGGKPGGGNTPGGGGGGSGGGAASSHVSAVLTCKVCDQAFSSLKELSNHMVKNSHYKEHIMRSITESGGRRRQTREKRKKSLPVRKLLELERAQHELKNGEGGMMVGGGGKIGREPPTTGRITCEKCGEKIETSIFVDHIRQCVGGGSIGTNQRNLLKSALLSSNIIPPDNPLPIAERDCRKSSCEEPVPPTTPRHHRSPSIATDLSNKEGNGTSAAGDTSSPSVLNAIEKLIEKSFDSRARHGAAGFGGGPGGVGASPIGSSILKRLGIDESVDYTKPLVDPQTMNLLRSYHHHQQQNQHHQYRRERSGSESSSISERGIGRGDALTPDRKAEICSEQRLPTSSFSPRTTPEKRIQTPPSHNDHIGEDAIKKEVITDDEREVLCKETRREVIVKKEEVEEAEEDEDDKSSFHSGGGGGGRHRRGEDVPLAPSNSGVHESLEEEGEDRQNGHTDSGRRSHGSVGMHSPGTMSPRQQVPLVEAVNVPPSSPCRNSVGSPASSDRSGTPRSTTSAEKKPSSLGALSSMFDNLSGVGGGTTSGAGESATSSGGRSTSSHPLAALQKLCDKTERHGGGSRSASSSSASGSGGHASSSTSSQAGAGGTTPGAILAFSWACNDAVMTADSIMKCAFCDTPFISKGAYRHHLSKMHFVKDGAIPDPVALKAQAQQGSSTSVSASGSKAHNASGIAGGANSVSGNSSAPSSSGKSPQQQLNFEESPHSKFLKYTELAKQLSSKYV